jgi:hypothetical protein
VWWCTSVIPPLRKHKRENHEPEWCSEFQANLETIGKPCLKKTKTKSPIWSLHIFPLPEFWTSHISHKSCVCLNQVMLSSFYLVSYLRHDIGLIKLTYPPTLALQTVREMSTFLFFSLFFFSSSTGVWTQSLVLATQAFRHLSHGSSPFFFSYFLDKVSHFCTGQPWTTELLHLLPIAENTEGTTIPNNHVHSHVAEMGSC